MEIKNIEDARAFGYSLMALSDQIKDLRVLIHKIENSSAGEPARLHIYYGSDGPCTSVYCGNDDEREIVLKGLRIILNEYKLRLNSLIGGNIDD